MNRLVIIGAGGHGRVIADNALKNGYVDICFVDDHASGECMGFPIIGMSDSVMKLSDSKTDFIIAIGNNEMRRTIAQKYPVNWITLVHPSAQIGAGSTVGKGSVVMAGAVINACAFVGEHCIINTRAVIEHDNVIENYVHVSPNAALGGTVSVGECSHVGIGACVKNNITVCSGATIGAGAVVVKNIEDAGTYIGVPARKIK